MTDENDKPLLLTREQLQTMLRNAMFQGITIALTETRGYCDQLLEKYGTDK